jgi:membrane protein DedA with SNARE-associated domain
MFDWITSVIGRLGYFGVAALTFLENLFPPIPSELVIPLAGFVAAEGELRLPIVIAAGSIGSLAGAFVWYEVGRRVGERRLRAWVARHGRWLTLGQRDLDRAQQWFDRHGNAAVLVGVSLPAGFAAMPVVPFLLYSALGTVAWTAALAYAGVVLQAQFSRVSSIIDLVTNGMFVLLGLLLAWRYFRCWREPRECAD